MIVYVTSSASFLGTFPKGEGIWNHIFCDGFCKTFYLKSKQIESLPLLYMKNLL